jgi:hypothetical protein
LCRLRLLTIRFGLDETHFTFLSSLHSCMPCLTCSDNDALQIVVKNFLSIVTWTKNYMVKLRSFVIIEDWKVDMSITSKMFTLCCNG